MIVAVFVSTVLRCRSDRSETGILTWHGPHRTGSIGRWSYSLRYVLAALGRFYTVWSDVRNPDRADPSILVEHTRPGRHICYGDDDVSTQRGDSPRA